MSAPYYADKIGTLRALFGTSDVRVEPGRLHVGGRAFPIVDDVVVLLDPARIPARVRARIGAGSPAGRPEPGTLFAADIQETFGDEWTRYPEILPEHEREFAAYFDLVDLDGLGDARVADLGCGIGRWSRFLAGRCREQVLVDFSEAIFVARRNMAGVPGALFFMADLTDLPFADDAFDFAFCIGVLHHLPVDALDAVRGLRRLSPRLLVFLYYALDNRPRFWRFLLALVTAVRLPLSRVRSPRLRNAVTWAFTIGAYLPLIGLGRLAEFAGLRGKVPLVEFYRGKSLLRIRQDVYDRFFTRIEQRVTRAQIRGLSDAFREIVVSDGPPYWHFECRR
jgi:SAM-dependent methyltransferase